MYWEPSPQPANTQESRFQLASWTPSERCATKLRPSSQDEERTEDGACKVQPHGTAIDQKDELRQRSGII